MVAVGERRWLLNYAVEKLQRQPFVVVGRWLKSGAGSHYSKTCSTQLTLHLHYGRARLAPPWVIRLLGLQQSIINHRPEPREHETAPTPTPNPPFPNSSTHSPSSSSNFSSYNSPSSSSNPTAPSPLLILLLLFLLSPPLQLPKFFNRKWNKYWWKKYWRKHSLSGTIVLCRGVQACKRGEKKKMQVRRKGGRRGRGAEKGKTLKRPWKVKRQKREKEKKVRADWPTAGLVSCSFDWRRGGKQSHTSKSACCNSAEKKREKKSLIIPDFNWWRCLIGCFLDVHK